MLLIVIIKETKTNFNKKIKIIFCEIIFKNLLYYKKFKN